MSLPKIENLGFIGIIMAVILVFFYFILGFSGMMSALGIILLFIVPFYLILDNFDLSQDEKIVFSFFVGAGIMSSLPYWLGLFISFRIAIFASFVILIVFGILIKKHKGEKHA